MKFLRNRLTIPIKGFNRSIIYDLNRKDYFFIPNELFEIIKTDLSFEINSMEYRDFLLENEIIFEIQEDEVELFPNLNLNFDCPYDFTNLILDSDLKIRCEEKLKNAIIFNLTIIFKNSKIKAIDNNKLLNLIECLEPESIDLHFPSDSVEHLNANLEFISKRVEIFKVYTYNNIDISIESKEFLRDRHIELIEISETFETYSRNVFPSKFAVNKELFLEAKNYNSYLNKKIYIDTDGGVRNGLYNEVICNITEVKSFVELLNNPKLTNLWGVTKDKVLVCSDCEFRFMCVSPMIVSEKNHIFFREKECNYNPYISKWKFEDNYLSLGSSGVHGISEGRVQLNHELLTKINNRLWND